MHDVHDQDLDAEDGVDEHLGWHHSRWGGAGASGRKLPHLLQEKNKVSWLPESYRKDQQINLSGSQDFFSEAVQAGK